MFTIKSTSRIFSVLFVVISLLALTFSAIGVSPAHAAGIIIVNSLLDQSNAFNGYCTLREAINNANFNSDTTGQDCAVGGGAETIIFSVSGTITLGSTLPYIEDKAGLTIDGTGQTLTISGNQAVRVAVVAGAPLTLKNLTIANGRASSDNGGGIMNAGTLTVMNSTFSSNSATHGGGVYNAGTLILINSTFSGNVAAGVSNSGGGLYNSISGTASISNSVFSGNSASDGGGIINYRGTLTITNSSFSSNIANAGYSWGGGILNETGTIMVTNSIFSSNSAYAGGGIENDGGTLNVANSTFSANNSVYGGGILNGGGPVTITNSTFFGNNAINNGGAISAASLTMTNSTIYGNTATSGGGIIAYSPETVTIRNTIIASNESGGNCANNLVINGGNNIDDGTTCGWGSASGSMSNTNPLLGALANNGGPTQTFALLASSPAIDGVTFNAPNSTPSTDQRGVGRPQGLRYDIGAFELEYFVISGNARVAGATLSYTDGLPKTAIADGSGNYTFRVLPGWTGTVTPSKAGVTFTPVSRSYTNVTTDQLSQDYTASVTISGNTGTGGATLSYVDGGTQTVTADSSGNYAFTVPYNWSGTVTPSKPNYIFTPANLGYSNVTSNQTGRDYMAVHTWTISGNAGVAGVVLSYTDGTPKTTTANGGGNYSLIVSDNWNGIITPSKAGYTFMPVSRDYSSTPVASDLTGQNFAPDQIVHSISGNAGVAGATLSFNDGNPETVNSDGSGNYTLLVPNNWSGTVTPSLVSYTFTPANRSYTNVTANQTAQDYTAITYRIYLPLVFR